MPQYRCNGTHVSTWDDLSPQQKMARWTAYIDAIRWAPGELDAQEFSAFSKAAFYGIDQESAFNLVIGRMQSCGAQNLRLSKIRHSLARAYGSGGDNDQYVEPPLVLPSIEPYNETLLRETVGILADKTDESFFVARSQFTTRNRTPAGVLHKITFPGEQVWVTAEDRSADGYIFTNHGIDGCSVRWLSVTGSEEKPGKFGPNFCCLSFLERGQRNVWFLNNPIDGQPHHDERFAHGISYRCIEAVNAWRYLVLETDVAPPGLWLALLAMAPIRIAAVYHSGSRGYHALVRIDASSKLEADDLVEVYRREYVPLGACKGTLSAFRLTRLPNCFRGQTGQWQRLIYLCENPTGEPIKELPVLRKAPDNA